MDESSFTQPNYSIWKQRRAVISNMFSKRSISELQYLVRSQVRSITRSHISVANWFGSWIDFVIGLESKTQLVSNFMPHAISLPLIRLRPGKSSNLYLGFQCFAADTVSSFLFATCFDQLSFPDFQGDIVKAVDVAMPTITLAKFSVFFLWIIRYCPSSILMLLAPSLKGVVIFKKVSSNGCHQTVL